MATMATQKAEPHHPTEQELTIDEALKIHRKRGTINGLTMIASCLFIAIILMFAVFSSAWFIRTPYHNLSIRYYMNFAVYSPELDSYSDSQNKIHYDQCNDEINSECSTMTDNAATTNILCALSLFLLLSLNIFIIFMILPYKLTACNNKHIFKRCSTIRRINITLSAIIFILILLFIFTFSAFAVYTNSFPYKTYCSYSGEEDDIGCSWGGAVNGLIYINSILFFCILFTIILLIPSIDISSRIIHQPDRAPMLEEGGGGRGGEYDNSNNIKDIQNQLQLNRNIYCCKEGLNKWEEAKCYNATGYSIDPIIYSGQGVCSFGFPDIDDDEYGDSVWSCCETSTCLNAFNYTSLIGSISADGSNNYIGCMTSLNSITKASCHPLDKQYTPNNYNISIQSSFNKSNGISVCTLFCQQTYDLCSNYIWNPSQAHITIKDTFKGDSIQFCEHGLGLQVKKEVFTDKCFDAANDVLQNVYFLIGFISVLILFVN